MSALLSSSYSSLPSIGSATAVLTTAAQSAASFLYTLSSHIYIHSWSEEEMVQVHSFSWSALVTHYLGTTSPMYQYPPRPLQFRHLQLVIHPCMVRT